MKVAEFTFTLTPLFVGFRDRPVLLTAEETAALHKTQNDIQATHQKLEKASVAGIFVAAAIVATSVVTTKLHPSHFALGADGAAILLAFASCRIINLAQDKLEKKYARAGRQLTYDCNKQALWKDYQKFIARRMAAVIAESRKAREARAECAAPHKTKQPDAIIAIPHSPEFKQQMGILDGTLNSNSRDRYRALSSINRGLISGAIDTPAAASYALGKLLNNRL